MNGFQENQKSELAQDVSLPILTDREKLRLRRREIYQKNRERCLHVAKKSRDKNKEKINQRRREKYNNDPEKREVIKMRNSEWFSGNKEKV